MFQKKFNLNHQNGITLLIISVLGFLFLFLSIIIGSTTSISNFIMIDIVNIQDSHS